MKEISIKFIFREIILNNSSEFILCPLYYNLIELIFSYRNKNNLFNCECINSSFKGIKKIFF